jgi:hypothetical protein
MSDRTAAALAKLDELLSLLNGLAVSETRNGLIADAEALRRAVAAFHMEAIRFRMYSVDRDLAQLGNPPDARAKYDELRQALEAAGFHTRSHTAP